MNGRTQRWPPLVHAGQNRIRECNSGGHYGDCYPGALYLSQLNHCNSFEDWASIDFIYMCLFFNWVETWLYHGTRIIAAAYGLWHFTNEEWTKESLHYDDVTWTSCSLKSPVIELVVYQLMGTNIKVRVTCPLWGEFAGDRWTPSTEGQ